MTVMTRTRPASRAGVGRGLARLSAASFGTSGSVARALADAGWSSGAAVAVRVGVAALLLALPAVLALRGRWGSLRRAGPMVAIYGVVAVAGCQLCYFNAVAHLSIGVALLLEYLGTVLVVGWMWLRHGHRPGRLTVAGAGIAVLGLVLVLDLTGEQHLDLVGVLWGLGAAVGLAGYFVLSGQDDTEVPPIAFACGGMTVGQHGRIAVIVEQDMIRAPADEHRLIGGEQHGHERSQRLRPTARHA